MKMRNLIVAALLINGTMMVSHSAFGQLYQDNPNDLMMGFQNQPGGGTQDYIINLGPAANIVGGTTVVSLTSDFSLSDFDAVLGSSSSMFGGVIGAASATENNGTGDVFLTQLRNGGAGTPATPGSSVSEQLTRNQDNVTYSQLGTLYSPAAGTGGLDTGKTWESLVDPNNGSGTFQSNTGLNPDSSVSSSGVQYEDLWESSSSSLSGSKPFTYLGYFTLDLTGGSPKLTFTPKNAPATLTPPVIVSVQRVGSTATVVSSNAVPNHSYQLQYTASLSHTNWADVGSAVVANGTAITNTDSTATDSQRFYRVMAQ
jgi:hypothetical protein